MTTIKKSDDELQIVYGAVYVPDEEDSHGDFMTADEIRKMAHAFLRKGIGHNVDLNHNNKKTGSYVVESYIAEKGDPTYKEGTWVVGVHIPDDELWLAVKRGEVNGFSMEAAVRHRQSDIVVQTKAHTVKGDTEKGADGHTHTFEAYYNSEGVLTGGRTSVHKDENGVEHFHSIVKPVVTEKSSGHGHRFVTVKSIEFNESAVLTDAQEQD